MYSFNDLIKDISSEKWSASGSEPTQHAIFYSGTPPKSSASYREYTNNDGNLTAYGNWKNAEDLNTQEPSTTYWINSTDVGQEIYSLIKNYSFLT